MRSNTKYIAVEDLNDRVRIFTFHESVWHKQMREVVMGIVDDATGKLQFPRGRVVGAGFVLDGKCVGRSESLGIDSRGQADTALLTA